MRHAPDTPAHVVARRLIDEQLSRAERLIPAALEGDEGGEPLHDLRVALRRARSLAQLLGGAFAERATRDLVAQLRALAEPTGELRDLDVHLEARDRQLAALPPRLRDAGERVFALLEGLRGAAHGHLAEELASGSYRERLETLHARLADPDAWPPGPLADAPIAQAAGAAIAERHAMVCKRGRSLGLDTPDGQVHRVRIACKKLRYAVEFFTPLLGEPRVLSTLLRRLKKAQSQLGHFNDCTVQRDRLLAYPWDGDDPERTFAAGALVGTLQAEIAAARPALIKRIAALCDPALVRRVAQLE